LSKRRLFSKELLLLRGACGNNLKGLNLNIPLKRLIAVTGVSGSGKSSLVVETLYRGLARHFRIGNEQPLQFHGLEGEENLKGVRLIDQSPIGKSPRSNPATYLKIFDHIRKIFAQPKKKRRHMDMSLDSFPLMLREEDARHARAADISLWRCFFSRTFI